jgi:hypothetical protein
VTAGVSLERVDNNLWVAATMLWNNGHSDRGSPGRAFAGSIPTSTPLPSATPPVSPTIPSATPTASLTATALPWPTPTPFPPATATFSPTVEPTPSTLTPSPSATATPSPGATAVPTASLTATPFPQILLSEVMVDPQAVEDADGEFVELVNAGAAAVNLYNWQLVDGSGRSHAIAADMWIEPGEYLVLAARGSCCACRLCRGPLSIWGITAGQQRRDAAALCSRRCCCCRQRDLG